MKSLTIKNLILIEHAEIFFGPGLNILTGETGSGKSAVLSAIRLIAGERADAAWIRKGADIAVVEAVLEEGKVIRREIHRSGKNRCFVDDELVSLTVLRQSAHIEMVDQNRSHAMFTEQREMLDAFAGIAEEVAEFEKEREEEKELEEQLRSPRKEILEKALKDLALIEEAGWQESEEERLAKEHHVLTHAQELGEKMSGIGFALTEGNDLPALKRLMISLESCIRLDPQLSPLSQSMKGALLELEEVGRAAQNYADRLEVDPGRLTAVEKRIGTIESLKRRFGPDLQKQQAKLKETIDQCARLDALEERLMQLKKKQAAWAAAITEKRRRAAQPLAAKILHELQSLNIPHAKFEIAVGEPFGEVRFLFSANPGLPPIPLAQCASGGELSRLLLAMKTILTGENETLVFDEIDSNVGGQTAAILGQKILRLAEHRQVISVTHFVQVAKCGANHFLVSKVNRQGSAFTTIAKLNPQERELEYHRMLGCTP